jgi:hypothetical protein
MNTKRKTKTQYMKPDPEVVQAVAAVRARNAKRDQTLTEIAQDVMGIPTLEPRRGDGLDFHQVAVWDLRLALMRAWEQGAAAAMKGEA